MAKGKRTQRIVGTLGYPGGKVLCHRQAWSGGMHKHASYRIEHTDPVRAALDEVAHRSTAGRISVMLRRKDVVLGIESTGTEA